MIFKVYLWVLFYGGFSATVALTTTTTTIINTTTIDDSTTPPLFITTTIDGSTTEKTITATTTTIPTITTTTSTTIPTITTTTTANITTPITTTTTLPPIETTTLTETTTTTTTTTTTPANPYYNIISVDKFDGVSFTDFGSIAYKGDYPWHVSLYMDYDGVKSYKNHKSGVDKLYCNGAIINKRVVITTAHCLYDKSTLEQYTYAQISTGIVTINYPTQVQWVRVSNNALIHPDFNITDSNMKHNLALLFTNTDIYLGSSKQKAIKLNDEHSLFKNKKISVTGFGRSFSNSINADLRYYSLEIQSNNICRLAYGPNVCSDYSVFTTYGKNSFKRCLCNVESGSPLVLKRFLQSPVLVGIGSFVSENGCGRDNPDGFVNIAYYRSWIIYSIASTLK